jgi:hypothetical protein
MNHEAPERVMTRIAVAVLLLLLSAPVLAAPPGNGVALSEIVRRLEAQPGFIYVKSVNWKGDAWEVVYYRGNGMQTVRIDPRTGRVRP